MENKSKEASILLSAFLDKPRHWLVINEKEKIPNAKRFKEWVKRRSQNEPLEYITNKVSFYSRDFFIEKGVLIPRPETEILVDLVSKEIKNIPNPKVLEIGFGSGIISIMLALLNPRVNVVATDINPKALHLANKNAKKFGVSENINFKLCSYDDGIDGRFDILVSNPPYIKNGESLEEHVLKEPHEALFGGKFGHEFLEKLVSVSKMRGIKRLACEMGYDQKEVMGKILVENGVKEVSFYKDLSSLDRGFIARF
ncbi:MAG: protein-(glutamine-N5) methyltransferase, release factor-specific [Proteobacteria bacterium]|nr:MAG: protein-(glutamine-N5) methyltransferase, release factor-specific [Pseudomonadota bacterium]